MRRLRPRWSSLAVDTWRRPANTSAAGIRAAVLRRHTSVLALFSRVLFFDTAPRSHVNSHVQPSFSYRLHWHASFGDRASRGAFGLHSEGLPTLLAGIDADVVVPPNLPLEQITQVLTAGEPSSEHAVSAVTERARRIWVGGSVPACETAPSQPAAIASSSSPAPSTSLSSSRSLSPCEVVSEQHTPLFVSPRNLADLRVERRTSFAELGMYFSHLGLGNCCGRQNTNAPPGLHAGASVATLTRGPWCPPSTFWVLHRRSLDRMLGSLTLWQQAWDARALTRDQKRMRWEFTSCALLAPGEATLLLYYNHSALMERGGGMEPWMGDSRQT
jgi:hypothetical protein